LKTKDLCHRHFDDLKMDKVELRTRYFAASQERSQLLREDRRFSSSTDFLLPCSVSAPMELAMTILERSRATTPERFGNKLPQMD